MNDARARGFHSIYPSAQPASTPSNAHTMSATRKTTPKDLGILTSLSESRSNLNRIGKR
jgi:hypothetical protein